MTRDLAESFGLGKPSGALVSNVEKGSAAEKAGIQVSDVILKFDGKAVNTSSDLPRIVGATHPGSKVNVQLWRKGEGKEVSLTVAEMSEDKQPLAQQGSGADTGKNVARLGLVLSELTDEQKNALQVSSGLFVEEVKGAAARELERGDVILALGNTEVTAVAQINDLLKHIAKGSKVALLVKHGEFTSYIVLKLDEKAGKEKE